MDNTEFNSDFNEYLGIISKKCNRCFKIKNVEQYKYKQMINDYSKCCIKCIDYNIKGNERRRCIHNRQKFTSHTTNIIIRKNRRLYYYYKK